MKRGFILSGKHFVDGDVRMYNQAIQDDERVVICEIKFVA
jgi:hypothetical protein